MAKFSVYGVGLRMNHGHKESSLSMRPGQFHDNQDIVTVAYYNVTALILQP